MGKIISAVCAAVISFAAVQAADIYMAGDSTCAVYPADKAPMTGWGQVLQSFCKPGVKVDDRAVPGSAADSFVRRKHWDKLLASVKSGDFVIIQFGHNDQKNGKDNVTTVYPATIKKMIADVRNKGGIPVLVTSVPRARFNRDGSKTVNCGLQVYHDAMVEIGKETGTEVVDIYPLIREYYDSIGETAALEYYMFTSGVPGADKVDRTHLKKNGAEKIAAIFVDAAKKGGFKISGLFK
jgi:lysophospholipase L1-like esterase